ncbi:hypothetical protein Hanom_Chr10g00882011 [Helianthus anomalus]
MEGQHSAFTASYSAADMYPKLSVATKKKYVFVVAKWVSQRVGSDSHDALSIFFLYALISN